ncbi:Tfp pilus assembly protein [Vibrio cholerae]|nr:Tfp pilus assembly protein [Vibrio cholerae]
MANLILIAASFGSSRHSFWRWTCVWVMLLRKMHIKQMC